MNNIAYPQSPAQPRNLRSRTSANPPRAVRSPRMQGRTKGATFLRATARIAVIRATYPHRFEREQKKTMRITAFATMPLKIAAADIGPVCGPDAAIRFYDKGDNDS